MYHGKLASDIKKKRRKPSKRTVPAPAGQSFYVSSRVPGFPGKRLTGVALTRYHEARESLRASFEDARRAKIDDAIEKVNKRGRSHLDRPEDTNTTSAEYPPHANACAVVVAAASTSKKQKIASGLDSPDSNDPVERERKAAEKKRAAAAAKKMEALKMNAKAKGQEENK